MKTLFLLLTFLFVCRVFAEDALERSRELRREVQSLQTRENRLQEQTERLSRRKEMLETAYALVSGKLEKAPSAKEGRIVRFRFETESPKIIDNTETKKRTVIHRWLKLTSGKTYLFESMVKLEYSKDMKNIKFGGFVPVNGGKTQWPACKIGAGSFDWRRCSFKYRIPYGARFCLIYGVESGIGRVLFKDITVSELN